jgi:hypothetical protein
VEATRVIQTALLLGREQVPSEPPDERAVEGRAIDKRIIDLTSEVTEPEITPAPQGEADIRSERHHRTQAPATWPMGDVVATAPSGQPSERQS